MFLGMAECTAHEKCTRALLAFDFGRSYSTRRQQSVSLQHPDPTPGFQCSPFICPNGPGYLDRKPCGFLYGCYLSCFQRGIKYDKAQLAELFFFPFTLWLRMLQYLYFQICIAVVSKVVSLVNQKSTMY